MDTFVYMCIWRHSKIFKNTRKLNSNCTTVNKCWSGTTSAVLLPTVYHLSWLIACLCTHLFISPLFLDILLTHCIFLLSSSLLVPRLLFFCLHWPLRLIHVCDCSDVLNLLRGSWKLSWSTTLRMKAQLDKRTPRKAKYVLCNKQKYVKQCNMTCRS